MLILSSHESQIGEDKIFTDPWYLVKHAHLQTSFATHAKTLLSWNIVWDKHGMSTISVTFSINSRRRGSSLGRHLPTLFGGLSALPLWRLQGVPNGRKSQATVRYFENIPRSLYGQRQRQTPVEQMLDAPRLRQTRFLRSPTPQQGGKTQRQWRLQSKW